MLSVTGMLIGTLTRIVCTQNTAFQAHARSCCSSDAEHNALLAADRRAALAALRGAGRTPFPLPATAFVSMFGSPGEHGYGSHRCDGATAAGLAGWRCVCAFTGSHSVNVSAAAELTASSGSPSLPAAFDLCFDGGTATATLRGKPARGQAPLTAFFRPKATSAAAAASRASNGNNDFNAVQRTRQSTSPRRSPTEIAGRADATPATPATSKATRLHSDTYADAQHSSSSNPALWSCLACTLNNSRHEAACAACGAPRPVTSAREAQQRKCDKRARRNVAEPPRPSRDFDQPIVQGYAEAEHALPRRSFRDNR